MANKRNDWKNLLRIANEDLAKFGYSIDIDDEEEEGFFTCEIRHNKRGYVETYAENYYEEELSDLIYDALHYVKSEMC